MSRSCHRATFSTAAVALPRSTRASPVMRSLVIGLRLWGIALEPFCAGAERLLGLAHLGALQVADLGGQPLEAGARPARSPAAARRGDRAGRPGWTPTRARGRGARAPAPRTPGWSPSSAHGAADRPHARLGERPLQALGVAMGLEGEARELEPEGRRLGVDAVRAPDADGVGVLARPRRQRGDEVARARHHDRPGRLQLERQRRVEDVGGRQPVVNPAPAGARARPAARRRRPPRRGRSRARAPAPPRR